MKKIGTLILAVMVLTVFNGLKAQEYKVAVSGNKTLKIHEVGRVEITGYDGNEIIFSTEKKDSDALERAEGLKAISAGGLEDNSGIGLSVVQSGDVIEVNPMSKRSGPKYDIKVPKSVKVFYEHSTAYGSKVVIKDISSEIEASTNHSSLWLENITGPMTINTVHGKIEAIFTEVNQSNPTSIISVHGLIDVALPANTKADLKMRTTWGEIYTDMDIDFEESGDSEKSSTKLSGTINGGGVSMDISTSHSNIYLRTKK
jgi:hypothetical protein